MDYYYKEKINGLFAAVTSRRCDRYDVTSKPELFAIGSNLQIFSLKLKKTAKQTSNGCHEWKIYWLVSARVVVKAVEFVTLH